MRAFFRSSPRSLIEAARIDGATSFGVLWRVLLPQARPALMTLVHARLRLHLERVPARARADPGHRASRPPRSASRYFAGAARAGDPTKVAAAAVLVALPILVVYRLPAAALRPRHARGRDQGVRGSEPLSGGRAGRRATTAARSARARCSSPGWTPTASAPRRSAREHPRARRSARRRSRRRATG